MLSTKQAAHLVLAQAIANGVAEAVQELRSEFKPELNPGDRTTAVLDGVSLGAVAMTAPTSRLKVVEDHEFIAWVAEHVPNAIITTRSVNDSWKSTLLKGDGTWTDPKTGEVYEVAGLGRVQGSPTLTVTPNAAAAEWANSALHNALDLPALTMGAES